MDVTDLPLAGLKLLTPCVFKDERGFFLESYRSDLMQRAGIDVSFAQDNHSRSVKGTIRGMHFQTSPGQAKLVRVSRGAIWDVAVDIRPDSPTFGQWYGETLDDQAMVMMYIPIGFAHGFCVLSDEADVLYKCSSVYDGKTEAGFLLDDPDVGIRWPVDVRAAVRSARDRDAPSFATVAARLKGTP
jgi:dTDP-4-dehydrorhamnose 3,5-epimerase